MNPLSNSSFPSVATVAGAATSEEERARLAAIQRYAILDTPPEGAFDRITRLAAKLFDAPIAIVSIIDHDRIWFKSQTGLDGVREVPREPGLCSTAIASSEPLVLENAARDPRSADNSLVAGPFGLRFYVGVPLATNDGHNLGTLCVIDREPRAADPEKVEMLAEFASIVIDELELRLASRRLARESSLREYAEAKEAIASRFSLTDELTGLANRRALERELDALADALRRGETSDGAIAVLDIDGLKSVNDLRGHDVGDRFLRAMGSALADAFIGHPLFRLGGDEFVLLFASALESMHARAGVSAAIRAVRERGFPEIDASFGVAAFAETHGSPREALRLADSRMYAAKVSRR